VPPPDKLRQQRGLSGLAFRRLLVWLDEGGDSDGKTYLEMRQRLVAYFDRRNRPSPEDLADETLTRVAYTLEHEGTIAVTPPARYCHLVARFIFLEDLRRREHKYVSLDPWSTDRSAALAVQAEPDERLATEEQRLTCLDCCLSKLEPAQRELILEYYRGAGREKIEGRRDFAQRLNITANALTTRASRIRDVLERCVEACVRDTAKDSPTRPPNGDEGAS
jgi:DNA-directed RNA polymerase specialized sigma24 family protein